MHEDSYILVTPINWIDKKMFGMAMSWCQVSNLQLIMVIMRINYNWKDDDACYNVCNILTHLAGFLVLANCNNNLQVDIDEILPKLALDINQSINAYEVNKHINNSPPPP